MAACSALCEDGGVCSVCLRPFQDARLLSCLHSVCRGCVDKLSVTGEHGIVECPLCRSVCQLPANGAEGLPQDFTTVSTQVTCCDLCDPAQSPNKPTCMCRKCQVLLCEEHVMLHLRTAVEGGHPLDLLTQTNTAETQTPKAPTTSLSAAVSLCPTHGQPLRLHCGQCDVAVCGECASVGDHIGHKPVQYVKDIVERRKAKVAGHVHELEHTTVTKLERSLEAVDKVCTEVDERAKQVCAKIRAAGEQAVKNVERHVGEMVQEVEDMKEGRLKVLGQQREELKKHLGSARNAIEFSKRLLQQGNVGAEGIFSLLEALETRVVGLLSTDIAEKPQCHSRILFQAASQDTASTKTKESVGSISSCQASAKHSVILGQLSRSIIKGNEIKFTLQAKNKSGQSLSAGGDAIHPRWVGSSPEVTCPAVSVKDNDNGTYEISCCPTAVGVWQLEISVNGECMSSVVCLTCAETKSWDSTASHSDITITDNGKKAAIVKSGTETYMSVIGRTSMRHGRYTWKIKIGPNRDYHMLGVATKPLSSQRCSDYSGAAFCWEIGHSAHVHRGAQHDKDSPSSSGGDTFELCLDCDAHTLSIINIIRSGPSSTISNMPDDDYFQFAHLYQVGNSVEFVD